MRSFKGNEKNPKSNVVTVLVCLLKNSELCNYINTYSISNYRYVLPFHGNTAFLFQSIQFLEPFDDLAVLIGV